MYKSNFIYEWICKGGFDGWSVFLVSLIQRSAKGGADVEVMVD